MTKATNNIILKDGSFIERGHNRGLIKIGTVVRFNKGNRALMRVDQVDYEKHGVRLYGMNVIGEPHSAYAHNCVSASEYDKELWNSYRFDRQYSYLSGE